MTGAGDAGTGVEIARLRAENDALHDALLIANQAQRAAADRADAAERAVEPMLHSLDIGEGGMSAEIAGPIVQRLAMAMAVHFRASGAANYIEMGLNAVDAPFERYTVTVQRYGAKSAHMLRAEAEADRDRLSAQLAAARAEVEAAERERDGARAGKDHQRTERRRNTVRGVIAWLYRRADSMTDPHARGILNSAAHELGIINAVDKPALAAALDPPPRGDAGPSGTRDGRGSAGDGGEGGGGAGHGG